MKVKIKEKVPRWNSFCRLPFKTWEKLNAGQTVELKTIPDAAKQYLEIINKEVNDGT